MCVHACVYTAFSERSLPLWYINVGNLFDHAYAYKYEVVDDLIVTKQ